MSTHAPLRIGSTLTGKPAGSLRSAVVVKPSRFIEEGKALPGEPGAIYTRALEQHAILCSTLQTFGVETIELQARGNDPLEPAAGDVAVAFSDGVVLMRPTSMTRRGDPDLLAAEFGRLGVPVAGHISAPGLLDGNDVLLARDTAFVGVGRRGNELGRAEFGKLARDRGLRVVEVPLADGVPALRAVAGVLADDTILLAADKTDPQAFSTFRTVVVERGEEYAAGVLCLSERHVLANLRYRTSLSRMRRAHVTVEAIDLYDFGKIGLTPAMLVLALQRD